MSFDMNVWRSELRRGTVELCLLSVVKQREAYGYEIIERIREQSGIQLTESTVYPMLARLSNDGLLVTRTGPSPQGPPRRYFRLTTTGKKQLKSMIEHWSNYVGSVSKMLNESQGGNDDDCD